MAPKQVKRAESRLLKLPPESSISSRSVASCRQTRSALSLKATSIDAVTRIASNKIKNAGSPLLKLAPELRNRIYRYALCSSKPRKIPAKDKLLPPAILQVCSQIRTEAHLMYYHYNEFKIIMTADSLHVACPWAASIATVELRQIKRLIIDFRGNQADHDLGLRARYSSFLSTTASQFDLELAERFGNSVEAVGLTLRILRNLGMDLANIHFTPYAMMRGDPCWVLLSVCALALWWRGAFESMYRDFEGLLAETVSEDSV